MDNVGYFVDTRFILRPFGTSYILKAIWYVLFFLFCFWYIYSRFGAVSTKKNLAMADYVCTSSTSS
jgi:hypothetical protein